MAHIPVTLGTFVALVAACGSAKSASSDNAEDWTVRPPQPPDFYSYYAPDDEPNPCALTGPPATTPGEILVFSDDFVGTQVDTGKWNVANGFVGFASSLNASSPANVIVSDGSLFLVSDRNVADATDAGDSADANSLYPYVSGALDSRGIFARTYGKIEFRGRFPNAPGVWFALVGRPWTGDYPISKIEIVNRPTTDHTQVYLGHQWAPTSVSNNQLSGLVEDADFSQFHTYTIVWNPDSIEWFLDGVSKMRSTGVGVATVPTYWTMGAWVGGWPGDPTIETPFPVSFEIDYFRISRVDGVIGDPAVVVSNPKDTYFKDESLDLQLANLDEVCTHVDIYEGAWRLAERSSAPYRLSLAKISHGQHTFTFVATDGVRTGQTSLTFNVN